jgi:hypothetical protein
MGQAAGTAAALLLERAAAQRDFAALDVGALRARLKVEGAILDGTN